MYLKKSRWKTCAWISDFWDRLHGCDAVMKLNRLQETICGGVDATLQSPSHLESDALPHSAVPSQRFDCSTVDEPFFSNFITSCVSIWRFMLYMCILHSEVKNSYFLYIQDRLQEDPSNLSSLGIETASLC